MQVSRTGTARTGGPIVG